LSYALLSQKVQEILILTAAGDALHGLRGRAASGKLEKSKKVCSRAARQNRDPEVVLKEFKPRVGLFRASMLYERAINEVVPSPMASMVVEQR
jgi:hypothetical protein